MARTPLFFRLQRAFRLADQAALHGLSPLQALERAATTTLTRRQLLAGLGAGAALATLPTPARAAPNQPLPRIAVVGAGLAGLNCALTLHDAGVPCTLYEASGRVGGRVFTLASGQYWAADQTTEWNGELIDSGHRTMLRLASRFGLPVDDLLAAEPAGSEETYRFFNRYYRYSDARADFQNVYAAVKAAARAAPFPSLYNSISAEGRRLDSLNIPQYLAELIPGGISSPLGALLDTAYTIEYAADSRQQSALNLIYLLAYQPDPQGFLTFGESDEQFHIRGGNQQLASAMAAALPPGTLQTGQRLVRLGKTSSGSPRLTLEQGSSSREVVADIVVLALPFAVLDTLDTAAAGFDALKRQAIREQGRGRSGKTQLQCRSRFWNQPGAWPGISNGASYADTGYQSSWEVTRAQAGSEGILNIFTGGSVTESLASRKAFATISHGPVAQDVARLMQQAEGTFPGLGQQFNGLATQSLPHLSPYFGLSYSYYRPGQYQQFCGYEAAPQGAVHFCGEHTSVNFQGYMEGAVETGEAVAKAVLRRI